MPLLGKKKNVAAAIESPPGQADTIEIAGSDVILKRGPTAVMRVRLEDFMRVLRQQSRLTAFPDGSALPGCVKFLYERSGARVVAIELPHQVRQVRWITDSSPASFGPESKYEAVTLAFPYIVIVALFSGQQLSGFQQLFYRTEPVLSDRDALYEPNLLNVADGYGVSCWLCLQGLNRKDFPTLTWNERITRIVEHFWESGFNRSSEHHEHNSYWQKTTRLKLDPRVASIQAWQQYTVKDPLFILRVPWRPAGRTIRDVADGLLDRASAPAALTTSSDLITLVCQAAASKEV